MVNMKAHEKVFVVVMYIMFINFYEAKILPCPQSVESKGIC